MVSDAQKECGRGERRREGSGWLPSGTPDVAGIADPCYEFTQSKAIHVGLRNVLCSRHGPPGASWWGTPLTPTRQAWPWSGYTPLLHVAHASEHRTEADNQHQHSIVLLQEEKKEKHSGMSLVKASLLSRKEKKKTEKNLNLQDSQHLIHCFSKIFWCHFILGRQGDPWFTVVHDAWWPFEARLDSKSSF